MTIRTLAPDADRNPTKTTDLHWKMTIRTLAALRGDKTKASRTELQKFKAAWG